MSGVSKIVYVDKIICPNKIYYLDKKVLLEIIDMKYSFEWVCSRYGIQGSAQTEKEVMINFYTAVENIIDTIRSNVLIRLSQDICHVEEKKEREEN